MANLLQGMPDNVRVMSYADNVLILGETLDSVEAANADLEARIREHPCGPLRLKASESIRDVTTEGLSFLGNDGYWNGEGIDWEPKNAVLQNVWSKIEGADNADDVLQTIRWLNNWRRGYPLWKNGREEVDRYTVELGGRLAFLAPSTLSRAYITGLRIVVAHCRKVNKSTGTFPDLSEVLPDYQDGLLNEGVRPRFIRDVEMRLGIRTE